MDINQGSYIYISYFLLVYKEAALTPRIFIGNIQITRELYYTYLAIPPR